MRNNETKPKNKYGVINDKGSTLITVIVAIAFVTILTSIILGTTVVNVRMKGIDRRTKDDFYYAEKSLNDIYTGLGLELAQLAADEYEKSFKKVGSIDGINDFNMAETAEKDFRKQFMTKVNTLVSGLDATALQAYVLDSSKGHVDKVTGKHFYKKTGEVTTDPADAFRMVLEGVQVSVKDSNGFVSTISTDIVITIPTVDFLGTNAEVSDYGLIANKGLYITGGSSGTKITGNVYAGVHETYDTSLDAGFKERTDNYSKTPVYGGINIKDGKVTFDGNYIISKGDINLSGTNPQIKVNSSAAASDGNLANLWFTSIRTIKDEPAGAGADISNDPVTDPTIEINANVFALNDMTLNADNSSVLIKGNYYGYNDGGSGITDLLGEKTGRSDRRNSAIIVNGSNAYLDMRDINNFVLMGKAYIDFTSDVETKAEDMASTDQVVETAEGVALKTNQQLYLVPPDFLSSANPTTDGSGSFEVSIPEADLKDWFGYPYLDPDPGARDIGTTYTVKLTDGSKAYYYYLKFIDDENVSWQPVEWTPANLPEDTDDVKYIASKNRDGSFKKLKYTRIDSPIGTGGSISSQAMFFLKIMTSESTYEYKYDHGGRTEAPGYTNIEDYRDAKEAALVQPSPYRLHERINLSMGYDYFDLSQCVVGNSAEPGNAHYYAKNAVINYERDDDDKIQSNVLNNTDGMLRYAGYPPNLYKRYIFLCTELDGKENKFLDAADLGTPKMAEWKVTTDAPLCHFVDLTTLKNDSLSSTEINGSITAANDAGLKMGAYGACIATKNDLDIDTGFAGLTGNTFRGIAIVDGDITVGNGINVDGLLMATGTITLEGNNIINYNKGLIQSRIEKEMNIVKNWESKPSDTVPYKKYYLITYLADDSSGTPKRIYEVAPGSKIKRDRIEADYNDFMYYENWQKGGQ